MRNCKSGFNHSIARSFIGAAVGALVVSPILAESASEEVSAGGGVEEVVVTAQRRTESIQDVPIAITAVTGDMMDRTNVRGIEEIVAKAPNVSVVNNGGHCVIGARSLEMTVA